ncbi:hypothetical protein QYF36_017319 [Acer negundo]|nr:hypothetical protein QYF36_017319 [Acer negundo]
MITTSCVLSRYCVTIVIGFTNKMLMGKVIHPRLEEMGVETFGRRRSSEPVSLVQCAIAVEQHNISRFWIEGLVSCFPNNHTLALA